MNKNEGKAGTILLIIIILLLFIMAGIYGYLYVSKLENRINALENETVNQTNNMVNNNGVISEKSIKIDDTKDLVYDAEYTYKNFTDESYYSTNVDKSFSLKDIKLPYININSEDAMYANKEIKELFEEFAKRFEEEYTDTKTWYSISSYKSYIKDNLLSIIITTESGGTDVELYNHYTYNFNLTTLREYRYEEMYEMAGFNSSNINDKVEEAIKKCDALSRLATQFPDEADLYIYRSINNYTNSVKDKTIKCFIDDNNEFNVVVNIEIPAGRGEVETIITVK